MPKNQMNEKKFPSVFLIIFAGVFYISFSYSLVFAQNLNVLWGDLKPGRFSVGFAAKFMKDETRSSFLTQTRGVLHPKERVVPIYVWYPSPPLLGKTKTAMKFREYLFCFDRSVSQKEKTESEKKFREFTLAQELPEKAIAALLDSTVAAVKDSPPIKNGKFPVIVLGQGLYYESPVTHTILCEFLASHGFIVATAPLVGAHSPFVKLDAVDLESAVRDLEFVIGAARAMSAVDKEKIGVVGFDMGGLAGSILAMRNADVNAFVSLDSGLLAEHNLRLVKEMPDYDPLRLRAPLMQVTHPAEETFARFGVREDWSFLDAAKYSDRFVLRIAKMRHADYASRAMIEWSAANMRDDLTAHRKRSFELTANYILAFLNANLKNDSAAVTFLARDTNNSEVIVERKKANRAPISEAEFLNLLFNEGVNKSAEIYRRERAELPSEQIFKESTLNQIGYNRLYRGQNAEAILIFTLNTEAYPASANAFDSLAEAYEFSGDKERAILFYKKSLELDPKNENARGKIKQLEQSP